MGIQSDSVVPLCRLGDAVKARPALLDLTVI